MKMINEAKEELENTLRHNDAIREEERDCMDEIREQERVRMAQNTIIIFSESSSSDDALEKLSVESSGSGGRQIPCSRKNRNRWGCTSHRRGDKMYMGTK